MTKYWIDGTNDLMPVGCGLMRCRFDLDTTVHTITREVDAPDEDAM